MGRNDLLAATGGIILAEKNMLKDKANEKYKDTVFRAIFKEKKELLSLYNAVNGTDYKNEEELQINTLENAVYINMYNDVSCILDMRMNLYEHQSTVNPNMPLRDLFYVAKQLEAVTMNANLYSTRIVEIPTPKFITFYNGKDWQPETRILRLSDAFRNKIPGEEAALEVIVLQLNINSGYNEELKRSCKALGEYMMYVEKVRYYQEKYLLEQAVELAIEECISEGILKDFLEKQRAEAKAMSIFEYDQEKHMAMERKEHFQAGLEQGLTQGLTQGFTSSLFMILEKFEALPEVLTRKINETTDADTLQRWIKEAMAATSLEEFEENM